MYVEDQLWIAKELEVELPDSYLVATSRFPFIYHEDTAALALWDNAEEVITQTKKRRKGEKGIDPWPQKWIQIGRHEDGPYALDSTNGEIWVAVDGDIRKPGDRLINTDALVDLIHDGYRGKLSGGRAKKDTAFRKFNFWNEVNWYPQYHNIQTIHLFENQVLKRIDQNSVEELVNQLKKGGMHIIRINGQGQSNNEDFYDELWEALWIEGWWESVYSLLEIRLRPIANGGLLHVAIIWEHADKSLVENPNRMMDAISYLQDLDMADEAGCFVDTFYLGSPENGYKLKVEKR